MATEVIYIHNKNVPHEVLHDLAKSWGFKICEPDELMIGVAEDYKAWGNAFRMVVDLNEAGYKCPEDFEWSGASG